MRAPIAVADVEGYAFHFAAKPDGTCANRLCTARVSSRGLCKLHYAEALRLLERPLRPYRKGPQPASGTLYVRGLPVHLLEQLDEAARALDLPSRSALVQRILEGRQRWPPR